MNLTSTKPNQRTPDHRDIEAGKTLRNLRVLRGMSQTDVAKQVGVAFQQIQKYELGSNRIAVSRLCDLATAIDVHPSAFFEAMALNSATAPESPSQQLNRVTGIIAQIDDPVLKAKLIKRMLEFAAKEVV